MNRLLVIDTETGGIDPTVHSILSLGAVVWEDGRLGSRFEVQIVEPILSVTPTALQVNRIDLAAHAANALAPAEAMATFEAFVRANFAFELEAGNRPALAGHNIGFDIGFLKRLCRIGGSSFDSLFSHRSVDTASVLRFLALANAAPLSGAGLEEALQYFGISVDPQERHTALGDAIATAKLLSHLVSVQKAWLATDASSAPRRVAKRS